MLKEGFIDSQIKGKIGQITFGHPSHNSLTTDLIGKFTTSLKELGNDEDVNCILIQSDGERTFSAGANFDELKTIKTESEAINFFSAIGDMLMAIKNCPVFVFCRVHGKAVGGALGIIGVCDYVFAGPYGSTRLTELNIGIGPFVISPPLRRKLGDAVFQDMTISRNWKSPEYCYDKGLYNMLFKSTKEMDEYINRFCHDFAQISREAIIENKTMLWSGYEHMQNEIKTLAHKSGKLILKSNFFEMNS